MTAKISIVTDEISQDLAECEAFLDLHGLQAVELRTISGARVPTLDKGDLDRLREWARRGAPYLVAISPGLFKCRVDDAATTEQHLREVLPASLDLLLELGGENLIAFTFEGAQTGAFPAQALEAIAAAADACSAAGVPLLLENEPGYLASTAARTMELIEAVGCPGVLVNWDPCNGNEFTTDQLAAAVERITPRLRNVHVKNGTLEPGERFARCGPLREGEIDWTAHLAQLLATGYDGFFCVETHYLPVRSGSAVVLTELRAMLMEVGYAWPEDG